MSTSNDPESAANLIRHKLAGIYDDEPNARRGLQESKASQHRSKHQQYMYDLSNSGKSLAEIQTAWHRYYQALSDDQKHQVWNEFYREYDVQRQASKAKSPQTNPLFEQTKTVVTQPDMTPVEASPEPTSRNLRHVRQQLIKATGSSRGKAKEHLRSLGFGLACGFVALVIFLFGFFNERFIAPFITPSKDVSNAPIIIDANTVVAGKEPLITIPKLNIQVPVVYTEPSIDEKAVQKALEEGVLHYATTSNPGEAGNGVLFGHSSNNILNSGKYKFAFVLLRKLEVGDTFTLQKDSKRYVYKVYEKKVVSPSDLSVLSPQPGKTATMTLITCDPPGTSVNRMVVFGEQISPDPSANTASTAKQETTTPVILPSNAPTLWNRLWDWLTR